MKYIFRIFFLVTGAVLLTGCQQKATEFLLCDGFREDLVKRLSSTDHVPVEAIRLFTRKAGDEGMTGGLLCETTLQVAPDNESNPGRLPFRIVFIQTANENIAKEQERLIKSKVGNSRRLSIVRRGRFLLRGEGAPRRVRASLEKERKKPFIDPGLDLFSLALEEMERLK